VPTAEHLADIHDQGCVTEHVPREGELDECVDHLRGARDGAVEVIDGNGEVIRVFLDVVPLPVGVGPEVIVSFTVVRDDGENSGKDALGITVESLLVVSLCKLDEDVRVVGESADPLLEQTLRIEPV
jgi:hypothetical protein